MYSLQDVCRILGVNNRQLDKLMELAGVEKKLSVHDGRRKELTEEQLEQLRQVEAPLVTQQHGLARRVELLEREVRSLRAELAGVRRARSEAPERVSREPREASAAIGSDGLIAKREAARVAVEHGANSWAAALDWQWVEDDRQDRGTVVARVRAYLISHPRAGQWVLCQDQECSCHSVA